MTLAERIERKEVTQVINKGYGLSSKIEILNDFHTDYPIAVWFENGEIETFTNEGRIVINAGINDIYDITAYTPPKQDGRKNNGGKPGCGAKKKDIRDKRTCVRLYIPNDLLAKITGISVDALEDAQQLKDAQKRAQTAIAAILNNRFSKPIKTV